MRRLLGRAARALVRRLWRFDLDLVAPGDDAPLCLEQLFDRND